MRYLITFQDDELFIELTEQQLDLLMSDISAKKLIKINKNIYNSSYFKKIKEVPSSGDLLSIEQKKALTELQQKYKSDQKQITTVNQKELDKLKKLKNKLLK